MSARRVKLNMDKNERKHQINIIYIANKSSETNISRVM
jgi:hypothetical protein